MNDNQDNIPEIEQKEPSTSIFDSTEPLLSEEEILELERIQLENEKEARKQRIRKEIWEWTKTLIFAIFLYLIIDFFIARVIVDGNSMNPSIENGNLMLVNKMSYAFSEIEYGDIIVFPYPKNPEKDYIKRVIAKSGDTIVSIDGFIYVNGEQLDEYYLEPGINQSVPETIIPENTVFVMGDNRENSSDSRRWGPLLEEDVIGKAFFIYWPPDSISIVK